METKLPERINAMKCVSYDVESILDAMITMDYKDKTEITLEDIIEWVEDDVEGDLIQAKYFLQNENGEDL